MNSTLDGDGFTESTSTTSYVQSTKVSIQYKVFQCAVSELLLVYRHHLDNNITIYIFNVALSSRLGILGTFFSVHWIEDLFT